jgi:hypothetical protein
MGSRAGPCYCVDTVHNSIEESIFITNILRSVADDCPLFVREWNTYAARSNQD